MLTIKNFNEDELFAAWNENLRILGVFVKKFETCTESSEKLKTPEFRQAWIFIFKQGYLAAKFDYLCKQSTSTDSQRFIDYLKKLVELVLKLDALDGYREFMQECMVEASKAICESAVVKFSQKLTSDTLFLRITDTANKISLYFGYFDPVFDDLKPEIRVFATKSFINYMTANVYELFVEKYPDSKKTVYHLMKAMQSLQWFGRDELVARLIDEIKSKLLKLGMTTRSILIAYANVVQCLTFFDPSSVLVHKVCDVIKEYVTTRPETMKTIIKFITAERPGESGNNDGTFMLLEKQLDSVNDHYVLIKEESVKRAWNRWMPDPYDANPYESRLLRQSADVFSMLVMIYGSKEMFVKEYRDFLAERLKLNGWTILQHEQEYVKMMKNRFHDGELTSCEVMLRDMADSQHFCQKVLPNVDIRVISDVFWPTAKDVQVSKLEFMEDIKTKFAQHFERQKIHRKLRWFDSYGNYVKMSIGIGEKLIDIQVDLLHYSIIALFTEKEEYKIEEIKEQTKLSNRDLEEVIDWWIKKGCLSKEGNSIKLITDEASWSKLVLFSQEQQQNITGILDDEEDEDDKSTEEVNILDLMENFWNYIKNNMKLAYRNTNATVQNTHQVTPERLHKIVSMFMSDDSGNPTPTIDDVIAFMARKIRQNLVYMDNGAYYPTKELLEEGKTQ